MYDKLIKQIYRVKVDAEEGKVDLKGNGLKEQKRLSSKESNRRARNRGIGK